MKKFGLLISILLFVSQLAWGQVNISVGNTITENFTIGTSATATLPTGWKADKNTTVRLVGTYASAVTATEQRAGNNMSTNAANGIYNYAAGDPTIATDRSVGGISSSSASKSVNVYLQLTNNGADEINNFTINYAVEKYRNGSNAAGFSIQMYYSTDGSTWTSAGPDFLTSFAADADNIGYTTAPGATVNVTNKTLPVSLVASSSFYLAWNYSVTSGTTTSNAQALGIDDVSITASGTGSTPTISVTPNTLSGFTYVAGSGPSASQSYVLSGTSLDGSDVTINAPTNYEISLNDADWFASRTLTAYDGTNTNIYVRLKADRSVGNYNNEIISNAGGGATTQNVTCSGSVTAPVSSLSLEENFGYSIGNLTSVSSSKWVNFSGSGNFIQVTNGSLSYTGYPSSGTGNKIDIISVGTSAEDVYTQFATQGEGVKVYASFLLNLPNTTGLATNISTTGDYFVAFLPSTSITTFNSRVSIRQGTVADKYQIGLRANSSNAAAVWSTIDLDINTTYLIVCSYEMITGASNDVASLWINPSLAGAEPSADLTQIAATDIADVARILIRQGSTTTPNASIDGIRVATEWSQAPLPVELSSFSAATIGSTVKLNWQTATEVNNYGFDVERYALSAERQAWEKIGFVNGNGNSNSPKTYFYEDKNVAAGKYSYRLKQIDNDGQFEYSKAIEVDLGAPKKFELSQNYPNPFNPITTIRFNLPEAGNVKLTLFNILGQEIKTLVNEFKESGVHTINFDASELNSGMYIYKIEAGTYIQTRKMTLVK